ncbi:hypothetical protein RDWZM_003852 [Blomia tropicalis]|uniref:serine C-palmitoyltransferase n=1 Tax=Blomia tropicalis TaxID=40697 RepID=A0A9Q0MGL2_BLOTA|nr:hypothetical protein RDWZM_003852 [Blomia tropicalis]
MRLISTIFRILTTFGCYPTKSTGMKHHSSINHSTYCNGSITNGKSHHINGTCVPSKPTNEVFNGNHVKNGIETVTETLPNKVTATPTVRPTIPFYMLVSNYLSHAILLIFGHFDDFLRRIGWIHSIEKVEHNRDGYPALFSSFHAFYFRNIILRMINMWCHPIVSVPGATIEILERKFGPYNESWQYTGKSFKAINMGSYNYLGFAENQGPRIESILTDIPKNGVGLASSPNELGTFKKYAHLEAQVAQFLGVEDSVVIGMGFATNALGLPCLFGPGSLVISDQLNHASLVLGCKLSGAKVRVFKHNDMQHLEKLLKEAVIQGQPTPNGFGRKCVQPWKKIIIIVEGIYSMEGTIVNLPEVIRLKKRYKAYLYMDEAHSIGAMGSRGRGICDYYSCDPKEVDILMGTFTKSFAASGGYIAGTKTVIDYIRSSSPSFYYCTTMAPPVVQQVSYIMDQFLAMDKNNNRSKEICDIQQRILQLKHNTIYFRTKLKELGFHVDGDVDSPVVPIMAYAPAHLKCLIRELLDRGIATTGASFPVTSLTGIRARFCLSAAHTNQMIEDVIVCLAEIGQKIGITFDAK